MNRIQMKSLIYFLLAITLAASVMTSSMVFGQFSLTTTPPLQGQSEQQSQQQQLEQSSGGLTARINGNNFTIGDAIIVKGTVANRSPGDFVTIRIIDPLGQTVEFEQVQVTADNIFTYNVVAGENEGYLGTPMIDSGNYLLQVFHDSDTVEFTFAYEAASNVTGVTVSIVPDASSLTPDAFSPNPVEISVGQEVIWTNNDTEPHTVISGTNGIRDGKFDSSSIGLFLYPGETYEHRFTEAGEYPYYDRDHPNMVGTVIVGESGKVNPATSTGTNATASEIQAATNATDSGEGAATDGGATGGGTSASIVSGSSSLTDTAFQPNPVQVSVGDTITWRNEDTQPHTVVSGSNGAPDGKFDSSPNFNPLIAPGQTYEHTFTEAGEYPYYCALHPNMVGTVSVG